ncbi:MAG TPA: ABC transporter ATP-binding protein [Devosiaceae bacterium]|jgi:peptide/nickel transport system ATP-binding protein
MPSLLKTNDLKVAVSTRYGHLDAVRGVDLELARGESIGLVGESGSGKSLTCLALTGLLPTNAKSSGQIWLDGQEVIGATEARLEALRGRRIGMIFQDSIAALNPIRTVGSQLEEIFTLHRSMARSEARVAAIALMREVGISDATERLNAFPHQLSGGMNQRMMIALALAGQPDLLIADEPTTALDTTTQAQILSLIRRAREETGAALLLVTHDLGVVHETCDRVAVMYAGRIVETGRTRDVFTNPQHPYTAALVASLPPLEGGRARLRAIAGTVPQLHQMPSGCAFAPRCPLAIDKCRVEQPPIDTTEDGRGTACWRSGDAIIQAVSVPRAQAVAGQADKPVSLDVRSLTCSFPGRRGLFSKPPRIVAVNDVSFAVREGETLGIVGESGCGKSTVGRALMGLKRPDGGSVSVGGIDRWHASERISNETMQLVFQDSLGALDPRMRVGDQVAEPLIANGVRDAAERKRRSNGILEAVGLPSDLAERFPHQLSGGQRQRAVIARAMVLEPRILVLDEPIASLDLSIQAQIINLLMDLQEERDLTFVFISHDLRVVRMISHQVVVMYLGRIVEAGSAEAVLSQPQHPYTQTLRSAIPSVSGEEDQEGRLAPMGEPPSLIRQPSGCVFHPRCPIATQRCREEVPALRDRASGGVIACHLAA